MSESGHLSGSHTNDFEFVTPPFIRRTAINSNGSLGSFYDITCDRIVDQNIKLAEETLKLTKKPVCRLEKPVHEKHSNILKMIDLDPALRLSIALELTPTTRLAECFNYHSSINKNTRVLRYSLVSSIVRAPDHDLKLLHSNKSFINKTSATHIVVETQFGIDALVILQFLQNDASMDQIDSMLERICLELSDDRLSDSNTDEIQILQLISVIKVYSNISSLRSIKSIAQFQREIYRLRHQTNSHATCSYALYPLDYLFITDGKNFVEFDKVHFEIFDLLEEYITTITRNFNTLKYSINQEYPLCEKHLKRQLDDIRNLWFTAKQLRDENIQRFQQLISSIRRGECHFSAIVEALKDSRLEVLKTFLNELREKVNYCFDKESFIRDHLPKQFGYYHASDFNIGENDSDLTLQKKLIGKKQNIRILCSDDQLYEENPTEWNQLYDQLIDEQRQNPNLRLVYMDFTDHPYELEQFKLFPLTGTTPEDEIINVLLLGETDVGKSTFINTLANYFRFKIFSDVENNSPTVLIPTAFSVVAGSELQEHQVKHDGLDTGSNEDHEHPGQSVTQHCRSYIFNIEDEQKKKRKLRLIDTPGFADSRGLEQDEQNLKEVLLFVNQLQHLHTICVFIKSNLNELKPIFRSYLLHLFDFLGKDVRANLLFCFTNTRINFYTPGRSSRAVIKSLENFPVQRILFNDERIFCFDNETFRYFVAKKCGITFNADAINRYRTSWEKSTKEMNRFLQTIFTTMQPYEISNHRRSLKRAQLEVELLIRPVMETIRNLLRNAILKETTSATLVIELQANATNDFTSTCIRCVHELEECAAFYILCDPSHVIRNRCSTCTCPLTDHTWIQYELDYHEQPVASNESVDDIRLCTKNLCDISVLFAYFLNNGVNNVDNDLVRFQLEKMIHEEECICAKYQSTPLNPMLVGELKKIKEQYQNQMEKMLTKQQRSSDLMTIYKSIEQVNKIDSVQSQINAIKQWYQSFFHQSEFHISLS